MAIIRPKTKPAVEAPPQKDKADAFIAGAPDAAKPRGVFKGNKRQITVTIAPTLLAGIDDLAKKIGQSRAAVINLAILQALERGLEISGGGRG